MLIEKVSRLFHVFAMSILFLAPPKSALAQDDSSDDLITISSTIPFANNELGNDVIRNECTWDSIMPALLVLHSKRTVVSTDQDLAVVTGKKLYLTTTSIRGIGGANFSGPKWITLKGELYRDGKLLGNF